MVNFTTASLFGIFAVPRLLPFTLIIPNYNYHLVHIITVMKNNMDIISGKLPRNFPEDTAHIIKRPIVK